MRLLLFVFVSLGLFNWGSNYRAKADPSLTFEILGLQLGMSAQDADVMIQQHLKMTPEACKTHLTPRRYRPEGKYVDECVIANAQMELILDFAEVFPGKGTGSEQLYFISYAPKALTPDDKSDFVNRVLAKFGPATACPDKTTYVWMVAPYKSRAEALKADTPVLQLDSATPRLVLTNSGIRRRMEDASRETHKIPL